VQSKVDPAGDSPRGEDFPVIDPARVGTNVGAGCPVWSRSRRGRNGPRVRLWQRDPTRPVPEAHLGGSKRLSKTARRGSSLLALGGYPRAAHLTYSVICRNPAERSKSGLSGSSGRPRGQNADKEAPIASKSSAEEAGTPSDSWPPLGKQPGSQPVRCVGSRQMPNRPRPCTDRTDLAGRLFSKFIRSPRRQDDRPLLMAAGRLFEATRAGVLRFGPVGISLRPADVPDPARVRRERLASRG
jgi:hypothetical protein